MRVRATLVALALVVAACSSDDDGADATTTAPPPADPTTTATSFTTSTLPPEPVGLVAPVIRTAAAEEFFYFLLTDRFENGDPGNDTGSIDSDDPLVTGYLPTDPGFYHGGDIAGLESRLDYLEGLGVTALWITPAFTNRVVQGGGEVSNSSAGYHGYWQVDFTTVDPHLGTSDDMRRLVGAAHERGMKVFFDIVVNHTGDVITYAEDSFAYQSKSVAPYRDAGGAEFDDADFAGSTDFPELDVATSFPYTPVFASEVDAGRKAPAWLNDPIYYHNRGDSSFTGENSLYGDFFGLDDLFTEHPDVVAGFTELYQSVITEFDIDGFRVDTTKHVNDEFWEAFLPPVLETAAAAGKEDFFVFGEVFTDSPILTSHFTTSLPFPAVLDFPFDGAASQFVAEGAASRVLEDVFADDDWYTDADSNASMLVKFIGNHDRGRLGRDIRTANSGADDAELVRRMELGMELMFFSRGVPLVYYGDEQGFVGGGGDQAARQSMFPSAVASYNDDDLIGSEASTADDNFEPGHPLYAKIAELAALRTEHRALVTGAHINRWSESEAGIYAFSRIDRDERVEYLVVLNNADSATTATMTVATPDAGFAAVYPAGAEAVASDATGAVRVTVPALTAAVYRADALVPPPDTLSIAIVSPQPGAEVTFRRFRMEAESEPFTLLEVTFAVSVAGSEPTIIGTDDAPPYRLFWDSGDYPAGTPVEVMATADDLAGGRAVATSAFVLGER